MPTYLLTGASGNLGGNVVAELLERGAKVRVLVFPGDPMAERLPEGAERFEGDVTDMEALGRFFDVPEWAEVVVIHMAAIITNKLSGRPAQLTKFALYNLNRNNHYSSEKARRELGYTTRPFEETISDTLRWLRGEGLV